MDAEFLKNVRKELEEKKREKDRMSSMFNELTFLRTNPFVRRYLRLVQYDSIANREFASKSEDDLLGDLFFHYSSRINDTNGIYYCLGYFFEDEDDNFKEVSVSCDDNRASYKKYIDLENESIVIKIPVDDVSCFERTHSIIYSKTGCLYESTYYELQREFFETSVIKDQESAISLVLSK